MKKSLCIFLSIAMVLSLVLAAATAVYAGEPEQGNAQAPGNDSGTWGSNISWTFEDGVLTINGNGQMDAYSMSLDEYPWYKYADVCERVVITSGVTNIPSYAFTEFAMTSIDIAGTVSMIGGGAFNDCPNLASAILPEGLEYMPTGFGGCSSLEYVKIPSTLVAMHDRPPFYGCPEDLVIDIDKDNPYFTLEDNALYNGNTANPYKYLLWISLKENKAGEYVVNPAVESMFAFVFNDFDKLTCIRLPKNASVQWNGKLENCTSLKDIYIYGNGDGTVMCSYPIPYNFEDCPEDLTIHYSSIASGWSTPAWNGIHAVPFDVESDSEVEWSFDDQTGTLTISYDGALPEYCNVLWEEYENNITSIVLNDGITYIGNNLFGGLRNLVSVQFPSTLKSIGYYAFIWCHSLEEIDLPEGLVEIGEGAFYWNSALKSVSLPASLTRIPGNAFGASQSLKEFSLASGNTSYKVVEGALYTIDGKKMIAVPGGFSGDLVIPDGVETIACTFVAMHNLTGVTIPASVQQIDLFNSATSSFAGFTVADDNSVFKSENGVLFSKSGNILMSYPTVSPVEDYRIPDTVEYIVPGAFQNVTGLKTLTILGEIKDYDKIEPKDGTGIIYDCSFTIKGVEGTTAENIADLFGLTFIPVKGLFMKLMNSGVSTIDVRPGDTFSVDLDITINSGIVCAQLAIDFDRSMLELVSVEDKGKLGEFTCNTDTSVDPYILIWQDGESVEDLRTTGKVVSLTFRLRDTAPKGEYSISVANAQAYDTEDNEIECTASSFTVNAVDYYSGDVDDDGEITLMDVMYLLNYLVHAEGYETLAHPAAADVDGNAGINVNDAVAILRHIAGWTKYQILPYVK